MSILIKNTLGLKVLTDDGYRDFEGISIMGTEKIYKVILEDSLFIECSIKHKLFTSDMSYKMVKDLAINDELVTLDGNKKIISIEDTNKEEPVYDLIEVNGNHRYYTNRILSSNCEFISSEETLIQSSYIKDVMEKRIKREIFRIKNSRWFFEPEANHIYAVALDPSMGTGGDFAAIQVFDLTDMKQIAEWKSNTTPSVDQVKMMLEILLYIYTTLSNDDLHKGEPEIYWSFENNSCGEGILVAIQLTGIENFPGTMVSDGSKRDGLNTNPKTKITACSIFKRLIEKGMMSVFSGPLIAEIKNFVSSGVSYKAKTGDHDDLVMATLQIIRIYSIVSKWEDNVAKETSIMDDIQDITVEPMPLAIL